MTTRQAIDELHKRGYSGEDIIWEARDSQQFEKIFFKRDLTLAQALIWYVLETPNTRHCLNCKANTHHIQNCSEIH
jgi:hypothetical protein